MNLNQDVKINRYSYQIEIATFARSPTALATFTAAES
jgi:hypothetical protein